MRLKHDYSENLKLLAKKLNADLAIISEIKNNSYSIIQLYSEFGDIKLGSKLITQETYCHEVITQKNTVTYGEVGKLENMVLHPVYTAMQLESYIGVPIVNAQNNIIGTLNFSGLTPKPEGFSQQEINEVTQLKNLIQKDYASSL